MSAPFADSRQSVGSAAWYSMRELLRRNADLAQ